MEVVIEKIDNFFNGICYVNEKICFVPNTLIGEVVDIDIVFENKKYMNAIVKKYIKTSSFRINPKCPFYGICGGCNIQHISFSEENKWKEEKVLDVLKKFTTIDLSIIKPIVYDKEFNYRNKIVLHGDGKRFGLYKTGSNEIVQVDKCLLVSDKINRIISNLNNGFKECIIRVSNDDLESIISLDNNCNDSLITSIGNKKYYCSINSFFQVNRTLTTLLYDEVLNVVKSGKYKNVLDLYCGTGTIGIYISDYVDSVIGIDYNDSNISDANKNKELNNCHNISFICDKVENKIDSFKNIDLVIVDPPRSGLDKKTKSYLKRINPKTIVYVSCDVVTLARDINDLVDGYNPLMIKPFNMFPRTYHVETVSVLSHKNIEK